MPHTIHQVIIRFPEIQLATRDSHKLRGYFGNLFKEHSPLLHNHLEGGEQLYKYPMVQYKVLQDVPTLVGLNEGAELLITLFLKMQELQIGGRTYPVHQKNIESKMVNTGLSTNLHAYRFVTLWMALNQKNHDFYVNEIAEKRKLHLSNILKGNILSFFKAMNYHAPAQVMANLKIRGEKQTHFKNNTMLAFEAEFVTNCLLPDFTGLGKSVSRGFGSIQAC